MPKGFYLQTIRGLDYSGPMAPLVISIYGNFPPPGRQFSEIAVEAVIVECKTIVRYHL